MEKIKSFEDLDVWKKGLEIADVVHEVTEKFPKEIIWGLGSQMQRASISIPSNIAEDCERQHTPEYIQHCYIALGSCAELLTQLIIARKRKYINEEKAECLSGYLLHERRMLINLIKSLKGKR